MRRRAMRPAAPVVALALALAGALLWMLLAVTPPAPRPADAPATTFSADRAFPTIEAIARAPRPVGSAENERAAAWLKARMAALDAETIEQDVPLAAKSKARLARWSGRSAAEISGRNLIGILPGRDRARPAVVLMAHLDSVWGSPGAGDDALGVAVTLEAARAIRAQGRPERDVILLFTDAEELGLDGARAFFGHHPLTRRVGAVINMEARGAGGRVHMFETGPDNGAMMRLYAERVTRPATNSLAVLIYDLMPNFTDYTVAKEKGVPGFNLAMLGRGHSYHSPLSTPATIDRGSLQDMGDQALALAAALAFAQDLPARAPNAAFADLMGRWTISYPAAGGWLLLFAAGLLAGAALFRRRPPVDALLGDALRAVALLLHGGLLLTTFNALSGSGGADYYDRLAALPRLAAMAALLVAALLLLAPLFRRGEPRLLLIAPAMALMWAGLLTGGPIALIPLALLAMAVAWFLPTSVEHRGAGALLLLLLVGALVQAIQPTAAPLLHWPLLLGALAIAARAWSGERAGLAVTAICAAIGIGHLLAQANFIFLAVGAEMPGALALLLIAALPLILPLLPETAPRRAAAAALSTALLLALWVRFDPVAPSVPVYVQAEGATKSKG